MKKYTLDIHTSTVADGNMALRFGDAASVKNHRDAFLAKYDKTETRLAVLNVSHGDVIHDVTSATFAGAPELVFDAEALVTNEAGITLFLLTADCVPAVFFDAALGVVALVHLGWRPTVLGLTEKTIRHMEATYGTKPNDLEVYLGPSIQAPSYAFEEVTQTEPTWTAHLVQDADGLVHVDLPGYVKRSCMRQGVPEAQVHMSGIDTAVDEQYFSHANTKKTGAVEGRFATIATMGYANEAK